MRSTWPGNIRVDRSFCLLGLSPAFSIPPSGPLPRAPHSLAPEVPYDGLSQGLSPHGAYNLHRPGVVTREMLPDAL